MEIERDVLGREFKRTGDDGASSFVRVLTHNVLCTTSAKPSFMPYCAKEDLFENSRANLIHECIDHMKVDVCCFQEYEQSILDKMIGVSFDRVFQVRMGKADGVCVAWNRSRFYKSAEKLVDFESLRKEEKCCAGAAVVVALDALDEFCPNLIIATCHLSYDASPLMRVKQMKMMIKAVEKMANELEDERLLVLCGDFNDNKTAPVHKYVKQEFDWGSLSEGKKKTLQHSLKLKDAYEEENNDQVYTMFTPTLKDVIDFIYVGEQAEICGRLQLPKLKETEKMFKGLPNKNVPSDHVPLCIDVYMRI